MGFLREHYVERSWVRLDLSSTDRVPEISQGRVRCLDSGTGEFGEIETSLAELDGEKLRRQLAWLVVRDYELVAAGAEDLLGARCRIGALGLPWRHHPEGRLVICAHAFDGSERTASVLVAVR